MHLWTRHHGQDSHSWHREQPRVYPLLICLSSSVSPQVSSFISGLSHPTDLWAWKRSGKHCHTVPEKMVLLWKQVSTSTDPSPWLDFPEFKLTLREVPLVNQPVPVSVYPSSIIVWSCPHCFSIPVVMLVFSCHNIRPVIYLTTSQVSAFNNYQGRVETNTKEKRPGDWTEQYGKCKHSNPRDSEG